ncbi:MAG TPA: PIG-L family deacetylase [Terriglobales bacterium]|nr:PIG-L family deacetylase [Terriglobales bacterium]
MSHADRARDQAEHSKDQKKDKSAADWADDHYYEPLPQETGEAGLKLELRKLATTGRLMQVVAHPDDEDGGMLTLEARGKGVDTLLMTLTRGEGGQNKLGSNLFDELGVLRTLELLAADRYYGVEQRFSRVADFGYSKTPEETFQKWGGHDVALADIVRVIREFRPDVLVARFSGTERDGHGHHQASAILTREAFHAAADPARFPEQIKEGLRPWQAKKLYIGNVCSFGAQTCDADKYTLKLNTGKVDPVLGMSYLQFALKGLRHQRSQGLAAVSVPDGDRFTFYKLVDAVPESLMTSGKDKDGHEADFFDGIDTSLVGRLGDSEKKAPMWRESLTAIQEKIDAAERTGADTHAIDEALHSASVSTGMLLIPGHPSPEASPQYFYLSSLFTEIEKARALTLHEKLDTVVVAPVGSTPDNAFMAVPGESFDVTAKFSTPRLRDTKANITLRLPDGWKSEVLKKELLGNEVIMRFRVKVPMTAQITRPYWHRNDPERDTLNTVDDARYEGHPFPPPPVEAEAQLGSGPLVRAVCMVRYKNLAGAVSVRPLAVAPAFSILLDPSEQVIATEDSPSLEGKAEISSNLRSKDQTAIKGRFKMEAPDGWQPEPPITWVTLDSEKPQRDVDFKVVPGARKEGHAEVSGRFVEGVQRNGERSYEEGYSVVTRDDLGTFYYYQPAVQRVSIVDVKVPHDLPVGYVMGAGDEIPTVLRQIGMHLEMIPAEKLATEDLAKYQTIVLGIRAYEKQEVIANNKRLLDYVRGGGRLVVQYNTMGSFGVPIDFNGGKYTPYPTTLGRSRVSVEEAPVKILEPGNEIFHYPNEITQKDFDGWVQERGLYFMSSWAPEFTPLLESHDPGEPEQKGGLLVAKYGKGTYIYCAYDFFRQLPAGVPGAVRLFVNMVAGH